MQRGRVISYSKKTGQLCCNSIFNLDKAPYKVMQDVLSKLQTIIAISNSMDKSRLQTYTSPLGENGTSKVCSLSGHVPLVKHGKLMQISPELFDKSC